MLNFKLQVPSNDLDLKNAVCEFVKDEFQAELDFQPQNETAEQHKDASTVGILWEIAVFIATAEGTMQFAERAKRMKRVQKLAEAIKKSGKSVYLKVGESKAFDLAQKSIDEIMDLLANRFRDDD
ncbi:MAG: hypothetical protein HWE34_09135 [Methylocystaceae bacterium]|nr:hypothetical protein [Methylocystaceae bacterium]